MLNKPQKEEIVSSPPIFNLVTELKTVKGFAAAAAAAEQQSMMVSVLCFGPQVYSWGRTSGYWLSLSVAMDNIGPRVFIPDRASLTFQTQSGIYAFREAAINETTSSGNKEEVRIVT